VLLTALILKVKLTIAEIYQNYIVYKDATTNRRSCFAVVKVFVKETVVLLAYFNRSKRVLVKKKT